MATKRKPPRKANGQFKKVGRAKAKRTKNPAKGGLFRTITPSDKAIVRGAVADLRRTHGDERSEGADVVLSSGPAEVWTVPGSRGAEAWVRRYGTTTLVKLERKTRNPSPKAPKRKRAGRPLREGQRVYHCATRCR